MPMSSCPNCAERTCDACPDSACDGGHDAEKGPSDYLSALVEWCLGQSGLLLLDIDRAVVAATLGKATGLLGQAGITLQPGDKLHHAGPQQPLHAILARIRKGQSVASARLGENRDLIAIASRSSTANSPYLQRMVLFRLLPMAVELPRPDLLEEAFEMSPAEAQVVLLMAQGLTAKEACVLRGSTHHTVRDQVRKALAKADLPSQKELLPLVYRMA